MCWCHAGPGCPSPGKHPVPGFSVRTATTEPRSISRWFAKWPERTSIAIATGEPSGLVVLDIDPRSFDGTSERLLEGLRDAISGAVVVHTGGGGWHYWFAHKQPCATVTLAPGIEIKGDGAYVICPPSGHVSGGTYWMQNANGELPEPRELPELLADLIAREVTRLREGDGDTSFVLPEEIAAGTRDITFAKQAGRWWRQGWSWDAIAKELTEINQVRCKPPWNDRELEQVLRKLRGQAERHWERGDPADTEFELREEAGSPREDPGAISGAISAESDRRSYFDLLDILDLPPRPDDAYLIPEFLRRGMNGLVGKSFAGKSHLAMHWNLGLAVTGIIFGQPLTVPRVPVLYLALEMDKYDLKDWIESILRDHFQGPFDRAFYTPGMFTVVPLGGMTAQNRLKEIERRLTDTHPKLLTIDTVGKVRTLNAREDRNSYERDVPFYEGLQELLPRFDTSTLLLHHMKAAADDANQKSISGSAAFVAACDQVLYYQRQDDYTGTLTREARNATRKQWIVSIQWPGVSAKEVPIKSGGRPKAYTKEQAEQVFSMHKAGTSQHDIAKALDMTRPMVQRILKSQDEITLQTSEPTPEKQEEE
jgi:hypothetical protein